MKDFFAKLKADLKETAGLVLKDFGRVFTVLLLFSCFQDFILAPAGRWLWTLALSTIPGKFISFSNILSLFSPVVLIIGLLIVIGYAAALLWMTSLMIVIMECGRQDKRPGILEIFRLSAEKSSHALKPKNWPMLFVALIFVVILDLFNNDGRFAGLRIPDYIMDSVLQSTVLTVLYTAAAVCLNLFLVKFVFSMHSFILTGADFTGAVKNGLRLVKKKGWNTFWQVIILEGISELLVRFIPGGIVWASSKLLGLLLSGQSGYAAATDVALKQLLVPALNGLAGMIKTAILFAFLAVLFARYMNEAGETLPGLSVKDTPKKRSYIWVPTALYTVLYALCLLLTTVLTVVFTVQPETAEAFAPEVLIAAHRGYSAKAPESTVPAFLKAYESHVVDYGELDVHPSKEGIPIVMHDANTERTTGHDAEIREMTLEEIKKLDAGSWFSKEYAGTKVPTLEEVMIACDGKIDLLIEIKNTKDCPEFEKNVVELIRKYDYFDKCIIQSPSYESLCKVKELEPRLQCGWVMAAATGAFFDLPAADFFSIENTFISPYTVSEVHKRGKKVFAWTINTEKSIREASDLRVDCIITDEPEKVVDQIHKNMGNLDNFIVDNMLNNVIRNVNEEDVKTLEELVNIPSED